MRTHLIHTKWRGWWWRCLLVAYASLVHPGQITVIHFDDYPPGKGRLGPPS